MVLQFVTGAGVDDAADEPVSVDAEEVAVLEDVFLEDGDAQRDMVNVTPEELSQVLWHLEAVSNVLILRLSQDVFQTCTTQPAGTLNLYTRTDHLKLVVTDRPNVACHIHSKFH